MYRLQGKLDTALAEQERLRLESDKAQLLSGRSREELRKGQEELQNVKESLDRALLQLSKSKEHEEKLKEDLEKQSLDVELLRDRQEKNQVGKPTSRIHQTDHFHGNLDTAFVITKLFELSTCSRWR